jgi:hypothetical protein
MAAIQHNIILSLAACALQLISCAHSNQSNRSSRPTASIKSMRVANISQDSTLHLLSERILQNYIHGYLLRTRNISVHPQPVDEKSIRQELYSTIQSFQVLDDSVLARFALRLGSPESLFVQKLGRPDKWSLGSGYSVQTYFIHQKMGGDDTLICQFRNGFIRADYYIGSPPDSITK